MSTRREAVLALGGIAALPLFGTAGAQELFDIGRRAHELAELRHAAADPPRALTAVEYETVARAAERIIPRTNTPGATDARVADFIDVMLADWYNASERARFRSGLSDLDAIARRIAGGAFTKVAEPRQIQILETLDRELHARRRSRAAGADDHWFAMLKYLTVWGYYTSRPGIVEELRVDVVPGRYDGNARY